MLNLLNIYRRRFCLDKTMSWMIVLVFACLVSEEAWAQTTTFDDERISCAAGKLLDLIQGSFGALVMIVAGIAAIFSAAMGAYRASISLIVVAVGAFVLKSFVALFFPEVDLESCLTNDL